MIDDFDFEDFDDFDFTHVYFEDLVDHQSA